VGCSHQQETRIFAKLGSEEQFQEEVRRVIHKLYSAARNSIEIREDGLSFEEVFVILLEIIGSVVGLSWGIYATLSSAISAPSQ
jgi:hypothetical protein